MKVLVADDDPASRLILSSLLGKWGYDVTVAGDGDEAWKVLTSNETPRLVVLDWMMPGRDGLGICQDLRRAEKPGYFYIVLLTAFDRKQDVVEGLEAGADDYITKPFEPAELRARLRAGSRILGLEADLVASREAFRQLALHDALTGLLSRRAIFDVLERELERARRTGSAVSVALCDVDRFKRVNDEHGHEAGDSVLVEVGRRMTVALRTSDAVGRSGGEEFLAVIPDAGEDMAGEVAERIRKAIGGSPFDVPGEGLSLTASVGVATTHGGVVPADILVSRASEALSCAKTGGRDTVLIYTVDV